MDDASCSVPLQRGNVDVVPEGSWVLTPKTGSAVLVFVCQDDGAHVCQRERNKESERERRCGADATLVGTLHEA